MACCPHPRCSGAALGAGFPRAPCIYVHMQFSAVPSPAAAGASGGLRDQGSAEGSGFYLGNQQIQQTLDPAVDPATPDPAVDLTNPVSPANPGLNARRRVSRREPPPPPLPTAVPPPPHTHTHTLPRSMESPPPYLEPAVSSGEAGGSNLTSGGSAEPALQLWVQYNRLPPCPQLSGYPLSIHPSHHFCPSEAGCKHS